MCETDAGVTLENDMTAEKRNIHLIGSPSGPEYLGGVNPNLGHRHPVHAIINKAHEIKKLADLQELVRKSYDIMGNTAAGSEEVRRIKQWLEVVEKAPTKNSTLEESYESLKAMRDCAASLLKLTYVIVKHSKALASEFIDDVADTPASIRRYLKDQSEELAFRITANEEFNKVLDKAAAAVS